MKRLPTPVISLALAAIIAAGCVRLGDGVGGSDPTDGGTAMGANDTTPSRSDAGAHGTGEGGIADGSSSAGGDTGRDAAGTDGDLEPVGDLGSELQRDSEPPGDALPPDAGETCTTDRLTIMTDDDDGEVDDHYYWPQGEKEERIIFMGHWASHGYTWGYFRFSLTRALSAADRLVDVRLSLRAVGVAGIWTTDDALLVFLEDSPDAAVVTSEASTPSTYPTGRLLVGDGTRWPESGGLAWPIARDVDSPNLASAVETLIATYGTLPEGTHVQLWVRGIQPSDSYELGTADSSSSAERPAELVITSCR
jgi:hypothetical protein